MSWFFHESDPMGGASGEAYANTLKSPGMRPAHVLAREAIQNSVDAGLEGQKVRVCFRLREVTGKEKKSFVEAAGLDAIAVRASQLELTGPNCLATLDKPRKALSLLYVEDHNAEGLSGNPHDSSSNFYRLLLSLGDRSKARASQDTGGSYGFGKSVYSSNSGIQTIFAYTRYRDTDGIEHTRIFGCGYYASHEYRSKNYSGRAWLGSKKHEDSAGHIIIDPLEGRPAENLAQSLGFDPRSAGDLGTTILIVDATVNRQDIVDGVEEWWWPRLIENKLDVEIFDTNGVIHVPRPKKNPRLLPFIESFEIARGLATAKSGVQKQSTLSRLGSYSLGTCGFVVAPLDNDSQPIVGNERRNSVALIRAPLMVVAYKSFSDSAPVVVGAFVGAPDIELSLKKSEPPAHDRWDPDSTNLRDAEGMGSQIVNAVLSRIRAHLRRFQSEAAPPAPAKQKRLSILERALGAYFRPHSMGRNAPPDGTESLLHLEFVEQPRAKATKDGMLLLSSEFNVTLDPTAGEEEVNLRLRLYCPVLEDDGQEGDDLSCRIEVEGVDAVPDPTDEHVVRFALSKGAKAQFKVQTEEYDPAWSIRFRPEIDAEVVS